ncbi:MAG: type II secretion system F family protein [Minisyncoccales bacterium]
MGKNQKDIINAIETLKDYLNSDIPESEKNKINSQIKDLLKELEKKKKEKTEKKTMEEKQTRDISKKALPKQTETILSKEERRRKLQEELRAIKIGKKEAERMKKELLTTERITLKRLGKKEEKKEEKKEVKPNPFIKISNKLFSRVSVQLFNESKLKTLEKDLLKANMNLTPTAYLSGVLTATMISIFVSIFAIIFLTFILEGEIIMNLAKTFWLIIAIPFFTFISGYVYPSLEKGTVASKIDQELPFATIHMSAISGSMIEPSKIFQIILSTKEYETLEKEFTKIMNGINIYGYNLVGSLKKTAERTSSKKLAELLNSMSTTITSGGNLVEFFDKRSKSLLFDYKLERERKSKQAETFMDLYISVVIAAPMIFMLLLVMMQVSGLGIEIESSLLSILMILGIGLVNSIFIGFLYIRGS